MATTLASVAPMSVVHSLVAGRVVMTDRFDLALSLGEEAGVGELLKRDIWQVTKDSLDGTNVLMDEGELGHG